MKHEGAEQSHTHSTFHHPIHSNIILPNIEHSNIPLNSISIILLFFIKQTSQNKRTLIFLQLRIFLLLFILHLHMASRLRSIHHSSPHTPLQLPIKHRFHAISHLFHILLVVIILYKLVFDFFLAFYNPKSLSTLTLLLVQHFVELFWSEVVNVAVCSLLQTIQQL